MSPNENRSISRTKSKKFVLYATCLSAILIVPIGAAIFLHNNVVFRGEIVYLDFEGGFYGIVSDKLTSYDPINLPEEYEQSGLRIFVIARLRPDLGSYHQWGSVIEIRYIRIID